MKVKRTKMLSLSAGRCSGTVVVITRQGIERTYLPSVHLLHKLHNLLTGVSPKLFWAEFDRASIWVKFKFTQGEILPILEGVGDE